MTKTANPDTYQFMAADPGLDEFDGYFHDYTVASYETAGGNLDKLARTNGTLFAVVEAYRGTTKTGWGNCAVCIGRTKYNPFRFYLCVKCYELAQEI